MWSRSTMLSSVVRRAAERFQPQQYHHHHLQQRLLTAVGKTASTGCASVYNQTFRWFSVDTVREAATAHDAMILSGYSKFDFNIREDAYVFDAVRKFAEHNVGALVTTNAEGKMTGIVTERDYICKIALLGKTSKTTLVKEIATMGDKLVTAKLDDPVELCMEKMLARTIRHLPIVDEKENVIGLISIKDLVKTVVQNKEETIRLLSDFALGKGGHFTTD